MKEFGILDHIWKDPQAASEVYARTVSNGEGATAMKTLFEPPAMTDRQFDQEMKEMDIGMAKLKEILERQQTRSSGPARRQCAFVK